MQPELFSYKGYSVCHIEASGNVVFKADPNRTLPLISFMSSGYRRPHPELSTVPCQSSATEGDRCYSTIGKSAAEGSPGHPETCLLCTADVPGLDTHSDRVRIPNQTPRKPSHHSRAKEMYKCWPGSV